ncbi:hypothetical protein RB623_06855 [Mesorhizobium sp. LHD-90]|uniref:hypothetical protein n=1 Tax=Mesorhizobium sp. LHD-90 TaxID=3071414 RepID=UPI0027E19003|nr:hypothetical protein [Mesorhizobium sp. LHD-90]MDQ6433770.1 hypothetical protein [Mesorhizobium sp. LHD-90]
MKPSELQEHLRQRLREYGNVYDVAVMTGLQTQRLYGFLRGSTYRVGVDMIDKLVEFFYPDCQIILGEAAPARFVPPEGWLVHPQDDRYYYHMVTREVLPLPQLRERMKAPAVKLAHAFAKVIVPPATPDFITKAAAE